MISNKRKSTFTSTFVRRHINRLATDTLFSTQELLKYGNRGAIDRALSRLVKRGHIIRLARGLFRRDDYNVPLPDAAEVAKYKANAFNKKVIVDHPLAKEKLLELTALELTASAKADFEIIFNTNGRSSSFRFGHLIIKLKGISQKKFDELNQKSADQSTR